MRRKRSLLIRSHAIAIQAVRDDVALAVIIPFPAARKLLHRTLLIKNTFQTESSDPVNLRHRHPVFHIARRGPAAFKRIQNIVLTTALHREQEQKSKLIAIGLIQRKKALELRGRELIEPRGRVPRSGCAFSNANCSSADARST